MKKMRLKHHPSYSFSRLDWNLLSTASPSINAWMNPSDRLTVAVIHFLHSSESRRLGVMASLMAEALDVQSIHVPVKVCVGMCMGVGVCGCIFPQASKGKIRRRK